MERSTRRAIIDYILANTKKAAFTKALKNFNFAPLVEPHRDYLLKRYFGDDGVRYSDAVRTLWDEHFTQAQAEGAQAATTELKAIKKVGGPEKDQRKAEKALADNTGGLEVLQDMYARLRNDDPSDDDHGQDDDDEDDEDQTINKDPLEPVADAAAAVTPASPEEEQRVTPGIAAEQEPATEVVVPPTAEPEPAQEVGTPGDGIVEKNDEAPAKPANPGKLSGAPKPGQAPRKP